MHSCMCVCVCVCVRVCVRASERASVRVTLEEDKEAEDAFAARRRCFQASEAEPPAAARTLSRHMLSCPAWLCVRVCVCVCVCGD